MLVYTLIHNQCLLLISSTAIATVALTPVLITSWTYSVTSVASVSNVSIATTSVALDFVFVISRMSLTCSSDRQQSNTLMTHQSVPACFTTRRELCLSRPDNIARSYAPIG